MSLPFGGIGGLNIDVIDAKNSGLQLFTRPQVDVSLLQGNDVQVTKIIIKYHFQKLMKVIN